MTQTNSNHKVGSLIIVDDEAELLAALCEILTGHGYETVGLTSGAEALAKLKEQDFDLLLTDLMMPEMSGIELLQVALEIDTNIVGIVMTGQGTVQTAVEAMKTGAFDYIMKPFNLNTLLPVLSRAMEVRHLRTETTQLRETVAMHELAQALAFSSDFSQILNKVTDTALQQCDADEASIMLPTSDGKELIIAVARGGHAEHIGKRIPMGQGIAGWVAQNRKPATLDGEVHDERFTSINPRADVRAAVSVPLLVGGGLIGVLNVNITRPHRPFTLGQVKTLNMLATIISPILENSRLYAEKRRAEEKERESEKKYRDLYNFLPIPVYEMDLEANIISANHAIYETFGGTEEDLKKGFKVWQILSPEEIDKANKNIQGLLKGEQIGGTEYTLMRLDGSVFPAIVISSVIYSNGHPVGLRGAIVDITERKRAEEELRASQQIIEGIINAIPVSVFWKDKNLVYLGCNAVFARDAGFADPKNIIGKDDYQMGWRDQAEIYRGDDRQVIESGCSKLLIEEPQTTPEGNTITLLTSKIPLRSSKGEISGILGTYMDITERKRAEEALRRSETKFRTLYDSTSDAVMLLDEKGFFDCNKATLPMFGCATLEEFCSKHPADLSPPEQPGGADSMVLANQMIATAMEKGSINFEWMYKRNGTGETFPADVLLTAMELDGKAAVEVVVRDITNRKRAGAALKESENKYRLLADNVDDVIFVLDMNLHYTYVSPSVKILRGYEPAEVLKQSPFETLTPSSWDLARRTLSEIMELEKSGRRDIPVSRTFQLEMRRKDGTTVWTEVKFSFLRDENQRPVGILGVTREITERKRVEEELKLSEERYRSIFENAQEGIFRSSPDGRIIMCNQAMAKMYGYESPEEMIAGVTDVARQHYVNPEDRRKLKEMIEEHGFIKGYEAQNCRKDGSIIWISRTMHAVRDENGQITYYDGIIEDITNRKQAVERIRKALGATVQAIAVTVETRDPYTAGHQRRVTDLARAITTEMNLPIDMNDGILMAAAIHDIGKISVPAEILSKPTKLTDLEVGIIKTHSQSGYDILKDIDFPWPIARMVLEHHERMNGSGYPNGLTGDNILMESRILAVADVVESMASHRPYRPSLGTEAALEEIEKNRGTLYDNAVADACLRLFREKGYQLQ